MRWLVLACGLCVAISSNIAWAQTLLSYKFREGERRRYAVEEESVMTLRMPGGDESATRETTRQKIEFEWIAEAVRPDRFELRHKNSRIRAAWLDNQGRTVLETDSAKGDDPSKPNVSLTPEFRTFAEAEMQFRLNSRGELSDWKLSPKLAAALKSRATSPDAGESEGLSEESLRMMVEQLLPRLPAEPVAKGSHWKHRFQRKLPFGEVTVTQTLTYRGPTRKNGRDLEQIDIQAELSLAPAKSDLGDVSIALSDSKGAVYFDRQRGATVELTQHTNLKLKIVADGAEGRVELSQTAALSLVE